MKKQTRFMSFLLVIALVIVLLIILLIGLMPINAMAAKTKYEGNNINAQDYDIWSDTVKSYLVATDSGYMRIQAAESISGCLVEYYDTGYNLTKTVKVKEELPVWGAFYETEDNYYILSGQHNPEESDSVEVYRITQYDKNWNRIASCGLYGANTTIPFRAGSARMAHNGNQLIIRTCHEMYGGHQANVTIQVDMSNMTIVDSYTDIMNVSYGYVSHSFNQFVGIEDNHIVSVDHGEGYPNSIVLIKYTSDISQGKFMQPAYRDKICYAYNLLTYDTTAKALHSNYTGVSIGGFAISDTSYIVAGNQDITYGSSMSQANIIILSMNKATEQITKTVITNYKEKLDNYDEKITTPHLITLASNRYLLIWGKGDTIYYTEINGNGIQMGGIYELKGSLSDCAPLVRDGKIVWYIWEDSQITFYDIDINNFSITNVTLIDNGKKIPLKDTVLTNGKIRYKITKASASKGEVEYVGFTQKVKGAVTIPAKVKINGISYKVTSIAKNAFKGNKSITKVTIGKNVNIIGQNAFYDCIKLKTVKVGENVYEIHDKAFYNCKSLTAITLPKYVYQIGKSAFSNCKKLQNITIKSSYLSRSSVGKNAFKGIPSNAAIKVPYYRLSDYKKILWARGVSKKAKISW